ncbi:uncharacterized protein H6S33_005384 [Morchella sextelata]|uniref:uncharacterized protein n=1 Tax=Morchella sextelata TaxID=1174677 RepID=UPI001D05472F|nr:uncharacterized protein H6S33_005384 [Morchella sextelata]KAH0613498.1 hypothetical protein H6S33_005384 [Morchella sextelata]
MGPRDLKTFIPSISSHAWWSDASRNIIVPATLRLYLESLKETLTTDDPIRQLSPQVEALSLGLWDVEKLASRDIWLMIACFTGGDRIRTAQKLQPPPAPEISNARGRTLIETGTVDSRPVHFYGIRSNLHNINLS